MARASSTSCLVPPFFTFTSVMTAWVPPYAPLHLLMPEGMLCPPLGCISYTWHTMPSMVNSPL
ncbi:hypothetical protein ID866_11684 [Astraeus odoratus]|nr:hypothetical protein ID866_11684 [Astraeus odoratus]